MIVDDELLDQMCSQRVLERSGMVDRVISFAYADEALAYLKQPDRSEVDLILLDINMPRLSGFDFLERAMKDLGDRFASTIVVMLTTSLAPADAARANQFAVVKDYISKPLSPEHVARICRLLETPGKPAADQRVDHEH